MREIQRKVLRKGAGKRFRFSSPYEVGVGQESREISSILFFFYTLMLSFFPYYLLYFIFIVLLMSGCISVVYFLFTAAKDLLALRFKDVLGELVSCLFIVTINLLFLGGFLSFFPIEIYLSFYGKALLPYWKRLQGITNTLQIPAILDFGVLLFILVQILHLKSLLDRRTTFLERIVTLIGTLFFFGVIVVMYGEHSVLLQKIGIISYIETLIPNFDLLRLPVMVILLTFLWIPYSWFESYGNLVEWYIYREVLEKFLKESQENAGKRYTLLTSELFWGQLSTLLENSVWGELWKDRSRIYEIRELENFFNSAKRSYFLHFHFLEKKKVTSNRYLALVLSLEEPLRFGGTVLKKNSFDVQFWHKDRGKLEDMEDGVWSVLSYKVEGGEGEEKERFSSFISDLLEGAPNDLCSVEVGEKGYLIFVFERRIGLLVINRVNYIKGWENFLREVLDWSRKATKKIRKRS
ncbi:MAG: hypothetical protein D6805_04385 [Planctomycetota bacterium]|nr:MAG: hypothetical protein D6805_04385 [Planctomycetota bacterium]